MEALSAESLTISAMARTKNQLQSVHEGQFDLEAFKLNLALAGWPQKALLEFTARLSHTRKNPLTC